MSLLFLVLVADLPSSISSASGTSRSCDNISQNGNLEVWFSAYVDDVLCWVVGRTKEELEHLLATVVTFPNQNYLALNESKTQILWASSSSKGTSIKVLSSVVEPADKLEVLGVSFNKKLSPLPYVNLLISSTKTLTAIARTQEALSPFPIRGVEIGDGLALQGKNWLYLSSAQTETK